jgi:MFS family permease
VRPASGIAAVREQRAGAGEGGAAPLTAPAARDDAPFPNPAYAWYVAFLLFLANNFAFIDRILVAILTPSLQADLGISDTEAGLLQGLAFALFYALFGLPMGWIADRANRKWLLAAGMAAWSLMTAACGTAKSFGALFATRIGVGIGEASLTPCASSLVGDYFPPSARARAFGLFIMGNTFGAGLTYALGGLAFDWLSDRGGLAFPLLGHLRPWQAMFVLAGAPGLLISLLFLLTVREPARREVSSGEGKGASLAQIRSFVGANRITFLCMYLGIALMAMTGFVFVNWLPTLFLRSYGWQPSHFTLVYGPLVFVAGIIGSATAGTLASWLKRRNMPDGTLRGCLIGSAGASVLAVAGPLLPVPEAALGCYVAANLLATYMGVLAFTAISEVVPNEMRGVMTAVYYLMINLIAGGLAPVAVGMVTDYVFHDKQAIALSLVVVTLATAIPGALILGFGLRFYRQSLARATWREEPVHD